MAVTQDLPYFFQETCWYQCLGALIEQWISITFLNSLLLIPIWDLAHNFLSIGVWSSTPKLEGWTPGSSSPRQVCIKNFWLIQAPDCSYFDTPSSLKRMPAKERLMRRVENQRKSESREAKRPSENWFNSKKENAPREKSDRWEIRTLWFSHRFLCVENGLCMVGFRWFLKSVNKSHKMSQIYSAGNDKKHKLLEMLNTFDLNAITILFQEQLMELTVPYRWSSCLLLIMSSFINIYQTKSCQQIWARDAQHPIPGKFTPLVCKVQGLHKIFPLNFQLAKYNLVEKLVTELKPGFAIKTVSFKISMILYDYLFQTSLLTIFDCSHKKMLQISLPLQ